MIIPVSCRPSLEEFDSARLHAGDAVEITGELITLRDASARRLFEIASRGEPLPVALTGRLLYAVGPSPPRPGQIVGSAGPTTTERMVAYLPALLDCGARGIIGKGELHGNIVRTFFDHRAVYLAAIGGLGALLGKRVVSTEVLAFPELGPEAVNRFIVERLPAIVAIDQHGGNLHETARTGWRR